MSDLDEIDRIRARAEGRRVAEALGLRARGLRYLCPSCHKPDLQVSERHFTCHHCSQHGDLIALVMLTRKSGLQEAVEWLASQEPRAVEGPAGPGRQGVAEQAWLETEQRFQAVFDQAAVGLALVSPNGQWLLVNQKLCEMTGYTQDELLACTFQDITYPEDLATDLDQARQVLAGEIASYAVEKRYIRKDGNLVWICLTVSLVREPSGRPRYFVTITEDISERKRSEQYLAAAYAVSCALLESSIPDGALGRALQILGERLDWQIGVLWRIEQSDHRLRCAQTWHHPSAEVDQFLAASQRMTCMPGEGLIGRVWATGQPVWTADVRHDTNYRRRDAAMTDHLHGFSAFPLRGERGIVGVIEFVCYDIRPPDEQLLQTVLTIGNQIGQFVERKQVEDVARAGEAAQAYLAALVASSEDAIIGKSLEGIITSWNHGAERLYGYRAQEVLGQPIQLLAPPGRVDEIPTILERIRRGEPLHHYETIRRRKDGHMIDVSLSISPVRDPTGRIIGASTIARDITERKEVEDALRESEARYGAVVEACQDGIVLVDPSGIITFANQQLAHMLGYATPQELIGRLNLEMVAPQDRALSATKMAELAEQGYIPNVQLQLVRKDGTVFPVEASGSLILDRDNKPAAITGVIRDMSERDRVADEVRQREARYRMLVEVSAR